MATIRNSKRAVKPNKKYLNESFENDNQQFKNKPVSPHNSTFCPTFSVLSSPMFTNQVRSSKKLFSEPACKKKKVATVSKPASKKKIAASVKTKIPKADSKTPLAKKAKHVKKSKYKIDLANVAGSVNISEFVSFALKFIDKGQLLTDLHSSAQLFVERNH